MKILILHGPNLGMLGKREPEHYGSMTLADINREIENTGNKYGVATAFIQSNHEGVLVDCVAEAITGGIDGIVINPAAYTHTSIALRDALEAARIPAVEVHLSNVASRDEFRKVSLTAPMCIGQITGLGADGYEWAMRALVRYLEQKKTI